MWKLRAETANQTQCDEAAEETQMIFKIIFISKIILIISASN